MKSRHLIVAVQHRFLELVLVAGVLGCAISGAAAQSVVGGMTPSQRPKDAPRITELQRDPAWYRKALTGVSKPYPLSLLFLDRQGDWYTPFTRPGAPNVYDIRGWFSARR